MNNLFADVPNELPEELAEIFAANAQIRIERIVSTGHSSPDGFWHDQEEHKWVVVLKGEAKLQFEDHDQLVTMKPGDHLNIPAHRVAWTSSIHRPSGSSFFTRSSKDP